MTLTTDKNGTQLTVRLSGELNTTTAPDDEATGRGYNCRCRSPISWYSVIHTETVFARGMRKKW